MTNQNRPIARFLIVVCIAFACILQSSASDIFVSPNGSDRNPGTKRKPLQSFSAAQKMARQNAGHEPVTVWFGRGTYYLNETVRFGPEDSGTKENPVIYESMPGGEAIISGGKPLQLKWQPYKGAVMRADVPADFVADQLFVNGECQHMARYPNFDPNILIYHGYARDAISPERVARWKDPRGGFIHAMHSASWGDMHYLITGKDAQGNLVYEGGWQNNRPSKMHEEYRFVENIFEELDAPGEWYHDVQTHTLYFYPPAGLNLAKALIETVRLRSLIELQGTMDHPVRFLTLSGLTFRRAARTFMDNREPMLRTDWTIYRGGALVFNGSEDCALVDCFIDQVGGNAVFVNDYNRRVRIDGCHIAGAGANGIAFVGDPQAVRDGIGWKQQNNFATLDKTAGPKSANFPSDCLVQECLIDQSGRVEKQTAPIEIDMSRNITVRHCSLYDVPRAGINIGDGCWGGHVIEFCDVFDTVKETGDHGAFNSWGRDRFWNLAGVDLNTITLGENKGIPLLDVVKPNILRNNRWRCDHGWDIDLDDGSSNYEIRDNLCLNGGLKNREGFYRVVENNIMVNNSFHPHVWFGNSQDIFRHNIVFTDYRPIGMKKPWGQECDFNLLHRPGQYEATPATELQKQSGRDEHSVQADALFVDPAHGDYRVRENSPALKLGFKNFDMDQFGVTKPALKKIARSAK